MLDVLDDLSTKTAASPPPLGEHAAACDPMLTIVHHPQRERIGTRHVVADREELTIGRGGDVFGSLALQDPEMSRRHLAVRRDGDRIVVRDLGSHNGTLLNGQRLDSSPMVKGDVLTLGSIMLLLCRGRRRRVVSKNSELIVTSSALGEVIEQAQLAAPGDTTVLIQGATGVGKELIAREIHSASGRSGELVAVNCAAIADGVVQSELFGHAPGAFSGAISRRAGLVAAATDGTLFLDEVGDASPRLQASLLRLLESREYRSVGDDRAQVTNARFVAATHVPLADAVQQNGFRQDLFGRLNRWVIDVPPLRSRSDDIVPLALAFARERRGDEVVLSAKLTLALLRYRWPSNVRELQAVIHQAVAACASPTIELTPIVAARLAETGDSPKVVGAVVTRAPRPERPSRETLVRAFASQNGNMRSLAKHVGVSRATLYRWVRELGLTVDEMRRGLP